jgi:hypothetical protein
MPPAYNSQHNLKTPTARGSGSAVAADDHELFLVRIWAEPRERPGEPAVYRGRIEHVRSAQAGYFAELEQLLTFIRRCLDQYGELPPGGFTDEFQR